MSVSGMGPTNTGLPFKFSPKAPPKAVEAAASLQKKITDTLADNEEKFLRLQAFELKKRVSFYKDFNTKNAVLTMGDIASQTANIIARLSALGRKV